MRLVVLCPEEEHWGSGGAIATWVERTELPLQEAVIVCPGVTAGEQFNDGGRAYALFVSLRRRLVSVAGGERSRLGRWIFSHLSLAGFVWIASSRRAWAKAEVVHVHNRPSYSAWLRLLQFKGVILLHMHNVPRRPVWRAWSKWQYESADVVLACSKFVSARIQRYFSVPAPRVMYNGTDIPPSRGAGSPAGAIDLVFAGRPVPEKGLDRAIAIAQQLGELSGKRVTLAAYYPPAKTPASRSYLDRCISLAEEVNASGIVTVELMGFATTRELQEIYATKDVFLFPCRWEEPFGMAVLEALASGLLVVAPEVGGLPEVAGVASGLFLVPKSAEIVDYVNRVLLLDTFDWSIHGDRRAFAQAIAERFDWESIRTSLVSELDRLL